MGTIEYICAAVATLSVIAAAGVIWLHGRKVKKTMKTLDAMLDDAIGGTLVPGIYDESALSALEAKLARYLSQCAVSSKKLLLEKDKIKALVSDISHQTKTPVANILLYAELLSEHELPEDCAVCVRALSEQAEKLSFLIAALVKTSRLETGIITVTPKREPVQRLLDAAVEPIKTKAASKGIAVTSCDTSAVARFDLKWTAEAVLNILDNAVKYTDSGGSVDIRVCPYELFIKIDIADTGIGITAEEQNRIFQRFYRSGAAGSAEGVGLGLYLSREIVASQGGYIKVTSAPGEGAVFSVFLPLET